MHIVVTPDAAYVPHCAAMLHSLFEQHSREAIDVHLLRDEQMDLSVLQSFRAFIERQGAVFNDHVLDSARIARLPHREAYPRNAWYKILAADYVQADRALYMDCDLIVRASLNDLWNQNLQGHLLAAVQDVIRPGGLQSGHRHVAELGFDDLRGYFNSGIMLMNLALMRAEGSARQLEQYALNPVSIKRLADQDGFNVVCKGRWRPLPLHFNVMYQLLKYDRFDSPVNRADLEAARRNPAVLHFCGRDKPWKADCRHPYRAEYLRHRAATPWSQGEYRQMDRLGFLVAALPLALRLRLYRLWPILEKLKTSPSLGAVFAKRG